MQSNLIEKFPQSLLNVTVSCFKNTKAVQPINVNLLNWLDNPQAQKWVTWLRSLDADSYVRAKKNVPTITPSGIFRERNAAALVKHSRLMQFDIDQKDNLEKTKNCEQLKIEIATIKNVAYCGLSASGKGLWGLIPIAFPEKHKQHFTFILELFASKGIVIDQACSDVSRLRIASYDPAPYFNHNAEVLNEYKESKSDPGQTVLALKNQQFQDDCFEGYIKFICECRIDITGGYNDWFNLGCSLANTFGHRGLDYFHLISQFHRKYSRSETDKQFFACLSGKYSHTIGTFYYYCKKAGIKRVQNVIYCNGNYQIIQSRRKQNEG